MPDVAVLRRLAAAHGIQPLWHDIWARTHEVPESTLRDLLAAMHVPADNDEQVQAALAAREAQTWYEPLPAAMVMRRTELPAQITLRLPAEWDADTLAWRLTEESGRQHSARFAVATLPETARGVVDSRHFVARRLTLAPEPEPGYHRLQLLRGSETLAESLLIVAPERCYEPERVQGEGRVFGPAAQLYALRSQRNWGIGDFTDLRLLLEQWAERGADVVGINPLHALFPHNPDHASPYSPSSRLFLNPLYLDPERIEDLRESDKARRLLGSSEFQAHLSALRGKELVDYAAAAAAKLSVLELLYEDFRARHIAADSERARAFRRFQASAGQGLRRHALFEALQEHFHAEDASVWGWPVWPDSFRDPNAPEVLRFAELHRERLELFEWLQWHAAGQLAGLGERAQELQMGLGLYGDLAVSADRGGAETWSNQELYALAASVGAPPDNFNLTGQNWGLPPLIPGRLSAARFAPFIAILRANMRHTGALRIDHVMGLTRLFWIPAGAGAAAGAYVTYPAHELLGILALESHRNRCLVIGEDLGTVPDELRHALAELGALSYRLFYFERRPGGDFKAPAEYPAQALVAASTHDLPTLAGFWEGRDLVLRTKLGLFPSDELRQAQLLERAQDRARILLALEREGLLPPRVAPDPASIPKMTPELARAIHVYLARTPSKMMMVQLEDVLGMQDQVNLPGTSNQYPNWRRKLTLELERWPQDERCGEMSRALADTRPRPQTERSAEPVRPPYHTRIPRATYRLQLHREFTLADAIQIVPYLADLGVSHVYCSPYLRARPGSTHGYDIIDHTALNPEIATPDDLDRFVAVLKEHGMGQILDVVPNHMGVMGGDNQWWLDVLENGRASTYADFFDIDWLPVNPSMHGNVLLPVLGDHYGLVLERGELSLDFDPATGSFSVLYFDHRFPVDPRDYARILEYAARALPPNEPDEAARAEFHSLATGFSHLPAREGVDVHSIDERNRDKEVHKRRLAGMCREHAALGSAVESALLAFNGTPGDRRSFDALHELLESQAYRLAYWRVASDEINYRRFFDINELAALRMEHEAVFEATHRLVLELVAAGKVDGLRIDHPDGLYDPAQYFRRLQDRVASLPGSEAKPGEQDKERLPIYLVIEKITAGHERVPESWPVHGTTGYRFANVVNGLFVDTTARAKLDRIYRSFTGQDLSYDELAYQSKRLILRTALASELTVLSNQLARIAQVDRRTRDFTLNTLRGALTEVIACFPVYRTYVGDEVTAQDHRFIEWAVARAKRRSRAADITIFEFVLDVLLCRTGPDSAPGLIDQVRAFARKFQQVTAPVMAKGVEDTAFYRYNRLVSLNEVGGHPDQFGFTPSAFHGASQDRAARWPHTMLATSTHDSKRSQDVRVRIDALSEMPAAWRLSLRRWARINRSKKRKGEDGLAPSFNDEYLLYQTLLGSWPLETLDDAGLAAYRERIQAYMIKAAREAKVHTSWVNVNAEYESALSEFVQALLGRLEGNLFLDDFLAGQPYIAWLGILNGLSQIAIKLASPGVPDFFQGSELWTLTLVDPDNRRPVDYARRRALLQQIRPLMDAPPEDLARAVRAMLETPEDGRCKLYLTWRGLHLRRARQELFQHGDYVPLPAQGEHESRLIAFARRRQEEGAILVAPRLLAALTPERGSLPLGRKTWGDTSVPVAWLPPGAHVRNVLTGRAVAVHEDERGPYLAVHELLEAFPVALLEYEVRR